MDSYIIGILVKNKINRAVYILKRLRLGILYKVDYKNIFFAKLLLSDKALPKATLSTPLLKDSEGILPKPKPSRPKKPTTN